MIKSAFINRCDRYRLNVLSAFKILTTILTLLFFTNGFAQNAIPVRGKINNDEGNPLSGVSVSVKGSNAGATTGTDGTFSITVPAKNSVLVVSYVGYEEQEISVGNQTNLSIQLVPNDKQLAAVVVVGYGTQKKADVTGAVSTVTAKDLNAGIVNNPLQAVQGKVSGLVIGSANSDPTNNRPTIRLRGTSSINASNEPLIVIDGVPGVGLNSVAPEDIERVDVLKDASAAAIYGSRAANGVILITTKRGKNGKTVVEYNTYVGVSKVTKNPDALNADEWRQKLKEKNVTGQDYGSNTNWFEALEQTAVSNNQSLAVSGGSDKFSYRGSLVYLNQPGIVTYSGFNRTNARINVTQKALDDRLEIQILASQQIANKKFSDYQAFNSAMRLNPTYPMYNDDGTYYQVQGLFETDNPLARLAQITNEGREKQTLLNAKISLEVIDGLKVAVNGAMSNFSSLNGYFIPSTWKGFGNNTAQANRSTRDLIDKLVETTVSYGKTISASTFNILVGHTYQKVTNEGFRAANRDFPDIFSYNNLGSGNAGAGGATNMTMSSYKSEYLLASLLARLNYSFDNKYLLTANLRRDGSSRFGKNNRYVVFPSVSGGWRISQEAFMQDVHFVNDLKLRIGYGVTGQQEGIADYASRQLYGPSGSYFNNGTFSTAYTFSQNANPDLKWETSSMTNVGIDFSLFSSRLSGSVEWYNKNTSDVLFNYPIAIGSRYGSDSLTATTSNILANVGKINNRGLEVSLSYDVLRNGKLNWQSTFNAAFNKNKVVSLSNDLFTYNTSNPILYGGFGSGEGGIASTSVLQEGYPIGEFYGPRFTGFDANGQYQWQDNGGGGNDPFGKDRTYLGSPQPKATLGWSNNFSYGNFDLSFLLRGSFGQKVANGNRLFFVNPNRFPGYNLLKEAFTTDIGVGVSPVWSSLWIEDGSFLRLDNFRLSYGIPTWRKYIKNADVYVSGQNLFLITKFKGIDPEARTGASQDVYGGSDISTNLSPGVIPINFYPVQRSIAVGLSVTF